LSFDYFKVFNKNKCGYVFLNEEPNCTEKKLYDENFAKSARSNEYTKFNLSSPPTSPFKSATTATVKNSLFISSNSLNIISNRLQSCADDLKHKAWLLELNSAQNEQEFHVSRSKIDMSNLILNASVLFNELFPSSLNNSKEKQSDCLSEVLMDFVSNVVMKVILANKASISASSSINQKLSNTLYNASLRSCLFGLKLILQRFVFFNKKEMLNNSCLPKFQLNVVDILNNLFFKSNTNLNADNYLNNFFIQWNGFGVYENEKRYKFIFKKLQNHGIVGNQSKHIEDLLISLHDNYLKYDTSLILDQLITILTSSNFDFIKYFQSKANLNLIFNILEVYFNNIDVCSLCFIVVLKMIEIANESLYFIIDSQLWELIEKVLDIHRSNKNLIHFCCKIIINIFASFKYASMNLISENKYNSHRKMNEFKILKCLQRLLKMNHVENATFCIANIIPAIICTTFEDWTENSFVFSSGLFHFLLKLLFKYLEQSLMSKEDFFGFILNLANCNRYILQELIKKSEIYEALIFVLKYDLVDDKKLLRWSCYAISLLANSNFHEGQVKFIALGGGKILRALIEKKK
jgi:hypothetical protein